jgi:hypothetical protein
MTKSERTTNNFFLSSYVTTSLILIPTFTQECVLATGLTNTTRTDEKLADIRECRLRVGTTFSTCRRQNKMSVVWWVEPTDTNPDIASQGIDDKLHSILFYSILFYSILFYSILFYSILFYSILLYSILFYSILLYSILFYSILFYSILFYSILFYSILFYSTFFILSYSILFYSVS